MAVAIGRTADQVRVLADLSGLVVGALIDDAENGTEGDAFADALRRYREEGARDLSASWRGAIPSARSESHAAEVLRHLTRDLLRGVSAEHRGDTATTDAATEAPPPNVRSIGEAREVPALELASDGTWKPSGSTLASQEEGDASTLRRNVPSARSRYPEVARADRIVLPPPPPPVRR
ncbi:MAG: hypothetical protein HYY42_04525 [Chloroflexi bacterium]|nr:hypothetical protein [Chloroflexota bacterium]MBI2983429.1 hypothetical protein [Chloroflexota bacterium]